MRDLVWTVWDVGRGLVMAVVPLVLGAVLVSVAPSTPSPSWRRPLAPERDRARAPVDRPAEAGRRAASRRDPAALPFDLVFPLPTPTKVRDTFGDARPGGRRHEGTDLLAPKHTPVLAVADGRVSWVHDRVGPRCCAVEIAHAGGWTSRYIHLDNDTPGTDDGQAVGVAPGIVPGRTVRAGELVGWVGDSGNAENVSPHLHFELRHPQLGAVDAQRVLVEARARAAGAAGATREADVADRR